MMNSEKCRIINFRAFAFGAVVMVATIFFAFRCFESLWYILPLSLMFVIGVAYFACKKSLGKLIYFFVVIVVSIGSTMLSVFTYNDFSIDGEVVDFECRVDSIHSSCESSVSAITSNVKINGKHARGKMLVTIYDVDSLNIGDKLSFISKAKSFDVFDLIDNNFNFYKNNIKYKTSVSFNKVCVDSGRMTLVERYKESTKSNLIKSMGNDIGGICYALLFGDKTLIDGDVYKLFKDSGTSHLLAISGLHISIIIGVVYFLLNKLKIKNIFKFVFMLVFLAFYCYLCDFAVSVIRAAIMGLVLIGTKLIGRRYDSLNSLGLAAMLILLFSPLSLFNVGFLLSFVAVLSIILFSRSLDKVKFPNNIIRKIITTMFITFVVSVMTYPITASFFREVSVYSALANLIVIPLFTVGFVMLFCFHLFACIGLDFLLVLPKIVFRVIFAINNFFSSLPMAVINVAGLSLLVALFVYIIFFIISRFVMLKTKIKAISCFVIFVICATIMLVSGINSYNATYAYFDCYSYSAVITTQSKSYLISPKVSSSYSYMTKQSLKNKEIFNLQGIVFTANDKFEVKLLQNFMQNFGSPIIYVPVGHESIPNLKSSKVSFVEYEDGIALNGNIYLSKAPAEESGITNITVNNIVFGFAAKDSNLQLIDYKIDYLCYDGAMQSENIKDIINDTRYIKLG